MQECGVVNRVTILTDKFGGAKGYAYIEFDKADAAVSAVLLDGTELRNRQIKVCQQDCRLDNDWCHAFGIASSTRLISASLLRMLCFSTQSLLQLSLSAVIWWIAFLLCFMCFDS